MKKLKFILSSLFIVMMLFALSACSLFDFSGMTPDEDPDTPPAGSEEYTSPYEIAKQLGYTGTEAEWVASVLSGSNGSVIRTAYDEAVDAGYTGTFLEFLSSYLTVSTDDSAAIGRAALSAVCITAQFETTVQSIYGTQMKEVSSGGSGVIYSLDKTRGDAYIITNYHVVYEPTSVGDETVAHISDKITVYLYGGLTENGAISATYVGGAMDYDIAILRIEGSAVLKNSSARAADFGNSDGLLVGQKAYAIGNPNGEGFSVTSGIVSVEAEYTEVTASDSTSKNPRSIQILEIRTDAAVNHGNSGGGLFSADGALIGIVNARSEQSGVEHFGYAIPSNLVLAVTRNILDNRALRGANRATLGIVSSRGDGKAVFDETTHRVTTVDTVVVDSVTVGGICEGVLQEGDVIYSVTLNSQAESKLYVTRFYQLGVYMFDVRLGDTLTIEFYRDGQLKSHAFTFAAANFTLFD